jgi:hypothetical protein
MKNKAVTTFLFIFIIFFLVFFLFGCWNTGDFIEETVTVDLEEAHKVDATIIIYQGDLRISGGNQPSLLISDFAYNLKQWAPEVTYAVENREGILKVIQKENEKGLFNSLINHWTLAFNPDIPLDLDIAIGNGENQLDLSAINLSNLKMAMGSGDAIIDLTGDYQENIAVYLAGGIGHTIINLPEDVGVRLLIKGVFNRIKCDGFNHIGNFYFNSAFNFSERKIYITLISGLGMIDINLMSSE